MQFGSSKCMYVCAFWRERTLKLWIGGLVAIGLWVRLIPSASCFQVPPGTGNLSPFGPHMSLTLQRFPRTLQEYVPHPTQTSPFGWSPSCDKQEPWTRLHPVHSLRVQPHPHRGGGGATTRFGCALFPPPLTVGRRSKWIKFPCSQMSLLGEAGCTRYTACVHEGTLAMIHQSCATDVPSPERASQRVITKPVFPAYVRRRRVVVGHSSASGTIRVGQEWGPRLSRLGQSSA